ncbi:hypothetical protein K1719_033663 [Acacia pycnantha]|nr:hypothetical protein K1719_033663 [Acacia pycnantha]
MPSLLEIDHPCAQKQIADLRMFEERLKKERTQKRKERTRQRSQKEKACDHLNTIIKVGVIQDTWREQVLAVLLVHTLAVGSSLNGNYGWMTGLGAAMLPNADALGLLLFEYSKCVYTSQLQHLKVKGKD